MSDAIEYWQDEDGLWRARHDAEPYFLFIGLTLAEVQDTVARGLAFYEEYRQETRH